jgi:hypothetical protein
MTARTLRCLAILALFVLAGCGSSDSPVTETAAAAPDPGGWRLSSGKLPTKAEFAALSATCEAKGAAFDTCLTDLGLKRAR